jgi:hypothetical protein
LYFLKQRKNTFQITNISLKDNVDLLERVLSLRKLRFSVFKENMVSKGYELAVKDKKYNYNERKT